MDILSTQMTHGVQGLQGPHRSTAVKEFSNIGTEVRNEPVKDEVRFSDEGLRLSETTSSESSSAGIRFDLVNRIKNEIAAGTYETADKMDIALDRLIGRLNPR